MPSKDYEAFNAKMMGDVNQASFSAQGLEKGVAHTKVRIRESCIEELIPSNSAIEIEQVPFHKLRFGDFVLVRDGKEFVIRRFVRFEVRSVEEIVIHVVNQKWKIAEEFRDGQINGRILKVDARGGSSFDPKGKEGAMKRINNRLTHFGTSSPWQRFTSTMGMVGNLLLRRKN